MKKFECINSRYGQYFGEIEDVINAYGKSGWEPFAINFVSHIIF